jgi:hypothetical protein
MKSKGKGDSARSCIEEIADAGVSIELIGLAEYHAPVIAVAQSEKYARSTAC